MHLVVVELGDVLLADAVNKDGGGEGEEGEEGPGSQDHGGVLRAADAGGDAGGAGDTVASAVPDVMSMTGGQADRPGRYRRWSGRSPSPA